MPPAAVGVTQISKAAAAVEVTYVSPGAVSVTPKNAVGASGCSRSHLGVSRCSGNNPSASSCSQSESHRYLRLQPQPKSRMCLQAAVGVTYVSPAAAESPRCLQMQWE